MIVNRTCKVCGKSFEVNSSDPKQCCSRKCSAQLRKLTISNMIKVCPLCGKQFHPRSNTQVYCDDIHYRNCPVCGKPVAIDHNYYEPDHCCSPECSTKLRKQTCLATYGVEAATKTDAIRQRLSELSRDPDVVRKKEQTCLQRYGVKNAAMATQIREKIRATVTSERCIAATRSTMQDRYGSQYAMQCAQLRKKQTVSANKRSSLESKVMTVLDAYNISYEAQHVVRQGQCVHTFDFYLPDYKILVDCDGVYYHAYLEDPDGEKVRDDYDAVRLHLVPHDHEFVLIVESQLENGIKYLLSRLTDKNPNVLAYDTEIFNWCRSISFPFPTYGEDRMKHDWKKLCSLVINKYNPYCRIGSSILNCFHRSIWYAHKHNCKSPYDAWNDDKLLKKIIVNRLIYKNDVDPARVLAGFSISKIAPKVSTFNPVLARYIVLKYLSAYESIFDPFSGYSGRMIGCASTGRSYEGQDINVDAVAESNQIISFLNLTSCNVVHRNILDDIHTTHECLLTCPPYNDKEIYGHEKSFKSCDEWITVCLNTYRCKRYVFVVDDTTQYADKIVETLPNKSHFGTNIEKIILIDSSDV